MDWKDYKRVTDGRRDRRERESKRRKDIKGQLIDLMKVRVRTAMIGALAQFEENFPEIIESEDWEKVRSKILRNGNDQIREIPGDFAYVDVSPGKREWEFRMFRED